MADLTREELEAQLAALDAAEGREQAGGLSGVSIAADFEDEVDPRAPRTTQTREHAEAPKSWAPASTLPDPLPRPGLVHRWIRVSARGRIDNTNVSAKFREHWQPVAKADYPEISVMMDRDAEFPDGIQVGGLVLCANSVQVADQRRAYYARMAQQQLATYDAQFRSEEQHPMPIHADLERRTQVQFGRREI